MAFNFTEELKSLQFELSLKDKVNTLYKDGFSMREIAKRLNISLKRVWKVGIDARSKSEAQKNALQKGLKCGMTGKNHSEETKKKISSKIKEFNKNGK